MSITNEAKNNVSVINLAKAGFGWNYDDASLTYDGEFDPLTGLPVLYDSLGTAPTFTNEAKNNVSFTNEAKNNV
jgi:hypothetical protein